MNIHIVQEANGKIVSVNRSLDGVAHFLAGNGEKPTIEGQNEFSIEALRLAMADGSTKVSFADATTLTVERHGVFV